MQRINDFLCSQSDKGERLYSLFGVLATIIMVAIVIAYLCRMRTSLQDAVKGVFIAALAYFFTGYAQYFMVWYRVGFDLAEYTNQTANLALGFTLLPLLAWLCAKTLNTSVGFSGDVTALTLLGYHAVGRSGCIFTGCCYGFACDWGIYSHHTNANQFPVCIVESLFALGILIFLILRICRKGYFSDGKNLPYFLLLYGACRFFTELTRWATVITVESGRDSANAFRRLASVR